MDRYKMHGITFRGIAGLMVMFMASAAPAQTRTSVQDAVVAVSGSAEVLLPPTQPNGPPGVRFAQVMVTAQRVASGTEVLPSQIKVTATVIAKWQFVNSGATK